MSQDQKLQPVFLQPMGKQLFFQLMHYDKNLGEVFLKDLFRELYHLDDKDLTFSLERREDQHEFEQNDYIVSAQGKIKGENRFKLKISIDRDNQPTSFTNENIHDLLKHEVSVMFEQRPVWRICMYQNEVYAQCKSYGRVISGSLKFTEFEFDAVVFSEIEFTKTDDFIIEEGWHWLQFFKLYNYEHSHPTIQKLIAEREIIRQADEVLQKNRSQKQIEE